MFDVLARIQELRESREWSVYKLAKLSGIPQSTIATWYQKNLYPPIDKIEILCNTFQISLHDFFSYEDFNGLSKDQKNLLTKWDQLSEKEKDAIYSLQNSCIIKIVKRKLHDLSICSFLSFLFNKQRFCSCPK